jgi:CBS domain-containing protein
METTMRVRDVMSRKPITIESSESCLEAVRRMHSARIRHLPVVDAGGRLVGIVTDRDLRHHLFSPAVFPVLGMTSLETLLAAAPVSDLMASTVVTVRPEHTLADAAQIMMTRKIGSLPVVEAGRVVGILTETDMLRTVVKRDAEAACAEIIVSFP